MYRIFLVLLCLGGLVACGGSAKSTSPGSPTTPPAGTTGGTNPVNSPAVVNASAGQTAAGVDVTVLAPAASPAPNAEDLGVAALTGSASAFNTGDVIHRGATQRVVLFGPGLSGNMQVIIRGPNDIQVSDLSSIQSSGSPSTPGIAFTATVSSSAMLGARTVVLQTPQGDVTTFTGGLEVVP